MAGSLSSRGGNLQRRRRGFAGTLWAEIKLLLGGNPCQEAASVLVCHRLVLGYILCLHSSLLLYLLSRSGLYEGSIFLSYLLVVFCNRLTAMSPACTHCTYVVVRLLSLTRMILPL